MALSGASAFARCSIRRMAAGPIAEQAAQVREARSEVGCLAQGHAPPLSPSGLFSFLFLTSLQAVPTPYGIKRLPQKGDPAVLSQLLALEKRLFKKADNWGGERACGGGDGDGSAPAGARQ